MTAHIPADTIPVLDRTKIYNLPPLILHPFAEQNSPQKLTQSSRASLIIQGLLPAGQATPDDLRRSLLDGRYAEIKMLYYVGKDVLRWIEQCLDYLQRTEGALPGGVEPQSFASLLIQHTPPAVAEKLRKWGVSDYQSIFSRGLGLNAMFQQVPPREALSDDFVRGYFRFADQLFAAYQGQTVYATLGCEQFRFDLFSSGEFSRMLEREWQ